MKPASVPPARRLADDHGVADYLTVSVSYVRALRATGVLRAVELPLADGTPGRARLLRFDLRDVDAWLDSLPRQ